MGILEFPAEAHSTIKSVLFAGPDSQLLIAELIEGGASGCR